MDTTKIIAVLFDFDGVIMDTETQYTVFWDEQGHKYLGEEDFGRCIKGQTLTQIYEKYFSDKPEAQEEITARLNLTGMGTNLLNTLHKRIDAPIERFK